MPSVGFEPVIPVTEWSQTNALDSAANGISRVRKYGYRGADKSLARPRREQATAIEDFDVHISYL